jgi:hypothetical protein
MLLMRRTAAGIALLQSVQDNEDNMTENIAQFKAFKNEHEIGTCTSTCGRKH